MQRGYCKEDTEVEGVHQKGTHIGQQGSCIDNFSLNSNHHLLAQPQPLKTWPLLAESSKYTTASVFSLQ